MHDSRTFSFFSRWVPTALGFGPCFWIRVRTLLDGDSFFLLCLLFLSRARLRTYAPVLIFLFDDARPLDHDASPLCTTFQADQNCPRRLVCRPRPCASRVIRRSIVSSLSLSGWAPQSPLLSLVESGPTPSSSSSRFGIALPVVSDSAIQWLLLFAGPPFCECSPIAGGVHRMRATTALAGRKPCFLSLSLLTHTLACACSEFLCSESSLQ